MVSMNVSKVLKELGIEAEVEHSDISNAVFKNADYYVLGRDVAESSAVSSIDKEKIIVLQSILSVDELRNKIKEKLNIQ
ncbi:phosphotransferase system, lactose/cellobiose-specific IIB subunit [Brachyspira pilosicoli 95/1000]|uniref:Phosphotransferase system, lactose/cellobiose-specific IIB subunit n=5 Tax=Brachyspira pilosicoli TaxID=52584 RepID=D8ID51_BRAP9|nr:phosphotransferase system, lactose/cellobiose-specific IIB subunit [Brachyspira pilosicoli 95/1000]